MPLVSVITPAYNAEKHIEETINSVISQTFKDWELIIVDDGSTDKTSKVIEPYLINKNIKYVYQQNAKQGKARNLGIENSTGKYIAFLDADDLWATDKLEKQIVVLQSHNVDVVYSQGWVLIDNEKPSENNRVGNVAIKGITKGSAFLNRLLVQNQIPMLSVILKREKLIDVNCFSTNPEVQNAEDYQLWLKLADNNCTFYGMEERLYYYRLHQNQSTRSDMYATINSIWAIHQVNFKTISIREKQDAMFQFINKAVARQLDVNVDTYLDQLMSLYKIPLNRFSLYFFSRMAVSLSPTFYKKFLYRLM